jgi:hypothetical protein
MSELPSTLQQGLGFLFGQPSWQRHLELTAVPRGEVIVVACMQLTARSILWSRLVIRQSSVWAIHCRAGAGAA